MSKKGKNKSDGLSDRVTGLERAVLELQSAVSFLAEATQKHTEIFNEVAKGVYDEADKFNDMYGLDEFDLMSEDDFIDPEGEVRKMGIKPEDIL